MHAEALTPTTARVFVSSGSITFARTTIGLRWTSHQSTSRQRLSLTGDEWREAVRLAHLALQQATQKPKQTKLFQEGA